MNDIKEYLQAPYPFFGGKGRVASVVWERFGNVDNYVEAFAGSLAVLLGNPNPSTYETANDINGMISNFWRAIKLSPEQTAAHADWIVCEQDLAARHAWMVAMKDNMTENLMADPDWHDPKIAGWWSWAICQWIGDGFCSGTGPWRVENGRLIKVEEGTGINKKLPDLRCRRGVNREVNVKKWFQVLSERLRRTRVCCGDWKRVLTPTATFTLGLTGIFLDPPYSGYEGYYPQGDEDISTAVREWAIEYGKRTDMRIAVCGYEGEHDFPPEWEEFSWKAHGGYSMLGDTENRENKFRERIFFSPHCLRAKQIDMFRGKK